MRTKNLFLLSFLVTNLTGVNLAMSDTTQSAQQQNLDGTTTGAPMVGPTLAIPADSMLAVNDEYTYIVQKINAEMDVMISECSMLGLKKPELLTGKQQQQPQPASNDSTTDISDTSDTSDNGDIPESPITNNDDEIVFQL